MIIKKRDQINVETFGDFKEIEATVNMTDPSVLFAMWTERFYSNPIGSIIREITSNCFDSHEEAAMKMDRIAQRLFDNGNLDGWRIVKEKADNFRKEPVIVKRYYEEGTYFISFQDKGVGLSPQRFKDIYMSYLSSTKRDSNNLIGFFGVGSKSPLSYVDSFEVITVFKGIEYHYIVGKSERGTPVASLFDTNRTEACNGTTIKIAIDHNDTYKFQEAVREQLRYFDNVYTIGFDIDNNYNIIETDEFKFRGNVNEGRIESSAMHIALGKVVYPINWETLKMSPINIPIGVKFDIGELEVTNNREAIVYTDEIIPIIKERIQKSLDKIRDLYNSQTEERVGISEFFKRRDKAPYFNLGPFTLTIPCRSEWKDGEYINVPLIEGLKKLKIPGIPEEINQDKLKPDNILFFLKVEASLKEGKRKVNYSPSKERLFDCIFNHCPSAGDNYNVIRLSNNKRISRVDRYLEHLNNGSYVHLIKKRKLDFQEACNILGLTGDGKTLHASHRRRLNEKGIRLKGIPIITETTNKTKIILEFRREILKHVVAATKSYTNIVPTEEFINSRKRERVKLTGAINVYDLGDSRSERLNLEEIENFKGIIIYGLKGEASSVRPLYELLLQRKYTHGNQLNSKALKGILVNKGDLKYFEDNPKFMTREQFISNPNRVLIRKAKAIDAWYLRKELSRNFSGLLSRVSPFNNKVGDILKSLNRLIEAEIPNSYTEHGKDTDLYQAIVDICNSNGWNDGEIESWRKELLSYVEGIELLGLIESREFNKEENIPLIVDFLKLKHKRLNIEYYKSSLKEPEVEEYEDLDDDIYVMENAARFSRRLYYA